MSVREEQAFWYKYELENNNEDTLHKTTNLLNIFFKPIRHEA